MFDIFPMKTTLKARMLKLAHRKPPGKESPKEAMKIVERVLQKVRGV